MSAPYRVTAILRSNTTALPNPEGVRSELELAIREQYSRALEVGDLTIEVELEVFDGSLLARDTRPRWRQDA